MTQPREQFEKLLRELFQFDCANLDFGIYRIMNHKRAVIERFITEDLPKAITDELNRGVLADQSQAVRDMQATAAQIRETLGRDALDADGNLDQRFHGTAIGQKYLEQQRRASGGQGREAIETAIFNHLYSFFSRYYQDGDFISKRRYSKRQRYAIPYNGEEVYLYWANHDQYYVKTTEHFHDYTFASRGVTVHFKLTQASTEQNNVKGEDRHFLPRLGEINWSERDDKLTVPFEYRPLTEQETIRYPAKKRQEAILAEALDQIPDRLKTAGKPLAALTTEHHRNGDGKPVSVLAHHLRQYTKRNTSDYFIHKDLQSFLLRELDFYLKSEVLNMDELEVGGEPRAEGWFQVLRVIRAIGTHIIDFLAQIENFQKMLWEKRKFVTETQYLITLGNIDEGFYGDIAACDPQWTEWKELLHLDEEQTNLFTTGRSKKERRIVFLQAHPTLSVDTRHFDPAFVDRLLASFEHLDEMIDGLLLHSENFQALSLITSRHREQVKCVYIDPPYNTGKDGFLYKDGYKSASWLSMMKDRLSSCLPLLQRDAAFLCSIDDHEFRQLSWLMDDTFGASNDVGTIVWRNARDNNPTRIAVEHEYVQCHVRDIDSADPVWKNDFADAKEVLLQEYARLKERGLIPEEIQSELRDFIKDNAVLLGEVDRYKFVDDGGVYTGSQSVHNPHPGGYEYKILHPITGRPMRIPANGYRFPEATMRRDFIDKDRLIYGPDENRIVQIKLYLSEYKDSFRSVVDLDGRLGAYALQALFGRNGDLFDDPKPPQLLRRLLSFASSPGSTVLDYFAGSGSTAQSVLEIGRTTGVQMRFILVEMAEYFDTVLIPRIKKVTFTPEWKDGKPARIATEEEAERSPRIVKYLRLESYEDALNNIAFDEQAGQAAMQFEDYLLRYMLKWETRKSETLLNVEKLAKPFGYKLTITNGQETSEKFADVPETFNYLVGLRVATRRVAMDSDRRYLVYRGRIDDRDVAVIWRETEGWTKEDLERDRGFVIAQKLAEGADEVFVNGDSFIPNAKALEPLFKARMFAPVES